MTAFLIYLLKATLATTLLYFVYPATIKGSTLHAAGRAYLLGTALAGCLLPLLTLTFHRTLPLNEVTQISDLVPATTAAIPALEQIGLPAGGGWAAPLLAVYLAGALWRGARLLASHYRVRKAIRRGERKGEEGRITTVLVDDPMAPCSWMHYILLPRNGQGSENAQMHAHERAHVALCHSADLLLVDLVAVLQWFNPCLRRLRADLCALHEFQADEAALRGGGSPKEYQYLLLQYSAAARGLVVANSLGSDELKARIRMMSQPRTAARKRWLLLCALPVLCLILLVGARVQSDGYNAQMPPLLLLDRESISLDRLLTLPELEGGNLTVISPEDASRICGHRIPGGILNITPKAEIPAADGKVSFRAVPGFNLGENGQCPLLLVNGVEFPYQRRKEFVSKQWNWKWFAFLHGDQAIPIYGEKARNGAFLLNIEPH